MDLIGAEIYISNRPTVPRFSAGKPSWIELDQADIVASIVTILFGAVHCFAWSFDFPSETERLLWRVAWVITTASPIVWTVLYSFNLIDDIKDTYHIQWKTVKSFSIAVVPFYLAARAILLLLAFISLRSLTPAAYKTVFWTTFIHHV